eukprot:3647920-Lingulodinium_polyedra.AAC.1
MSPCCEETDAVRLAQAGSPERWRNLDTLPVPATAAPSMRVPGSSTPVPDPPTPFPAPPTPRPLEGGEVTERAEDIRPILKIRDAVKELALASVSVNDKKRWLMAIHKLLACGGQGHAEPVAQ